MKMNRVRNAFLSVISAVLFAAGCGTAGGDLSDIDSEGASGTDNDVLVSTLVGGADSDDAEATAEEGMNAAIAKNLSDKVEAELNRMLDDGELDVDELDAEFQASKAINAGFNFKKGLFLEIVDEAVPFAGGEMLLNGGVNLTLRYLGGSRLAIVADGELSATLDGVEQVGVIRDLPYRLALSGSNTMDVNGSFSVTIKSFRVKEMGADLTARVVDSNVTATGEIAEKAISAKVDMMDVSIAIANHAIMTAPKAFSIECSGEVTFDLGNKELASCVISPTCRKCE